MKRLIEKLGLKTFLKRKFQITIKYNYILFPFLWTLTFSFAFIESFSYAGFLTKHIFFGFQFFLLLTILSGMFVRVIPPEKENLGYWGDNYKILSTSNNLGFLPLLTISALIVSLELSHYRNYVFSLYHVQPELLFWPCFLSGFLILLNIGSLDKKWFVEDIFMGDESSSGEPGILIKRIIVAGMAIWILIVNIFDLSSGFTKSVYFMIKYPSASYDQKMKRAIGKVYDYLVFVRENTPEDAVIMSPPKQSPWYTVGNWAYARYFLYPRVTIPAENIETGISKEANYVMIAWGNWPHPDLERYGWPKVEVPAEWVIYKKEDSNELLETIQDTTYDPDDERNKYAWGLIKIKKE